MESGPTQVLKCDRALHACGKFRSGVSLHSHTMHSREFLGRLPGYISQIPIASYIIEREVGRLHLYGGRIIDFRRIYWTPPLSPREALDLEKQQIEQILGLPALVSLSDHDNIEAGLHLQMLQRTSNLPVSVEWSAPYEQTVFHLGVHNLPVTRAHAWMQELAGFTANPRPELLRQLLHELNAEPSVLLILNHPYWDAESVGPEQHRDSLAIFLQKYGHLLHALELNGLRSRGENQQRSERSWLERNLQRGVFTGILRGPLLAEAYANMDLFVFPSRTDTFGNVVQEAAASGVPAIVTADGGPKHLVISGNTGFVATDDRPFIQAVLDAVAQPERLRAMGAAARENILSASWDNAVEMTYSAYRFCQQATAAASLVGTPSVLGRLQTPAS